MATAFSYDCHEASGSLSNTRADGGPGLVRKADEYVRASPVPDAKVTKSNMRDTLDRVGGSRGEAAHSVGFVIDPAFQQDHLATYFARTDRRGWRPRQAGADPAVLMIDRGLPWARSLLGPLSAAERVHRLALPTLATSLSAWLHSPTPAHRVLGIHRNTLANRVRLLGNLLGVDTTNLGARATLSLALRIHNASHEPGRAPVAMAPGLPSELVALPSVRAWARTRLRPLSQLPFETGIHTLATWIESSARNAPAASALGVGEAGLRKRIKRMEDVLGQPISTDPLARFDIWLAFRACALPHKARGVG
ncbi:helix-turn-helix domain-containing protein [Embleya sp. NPDC001921]